MDYNVYPFGPKCSTAIIRLMSLALMLFVLPLGHGVVEDLTRLLPKFTSEARDQTDTFRSSTSLTIGAMNCAICSTRPVTCTVLIPSLPCLTSASVFGATSIYGKFYSSEFRLIKSNIAKVRALKRTLAVPSGPAVILNGEILSFL